MFPRSLKYLVLFIVLAPASLAASTRPYTPNEMFVIRSIREIHRAEMTYHATTGNGSFTGPWQLFQAGLIDGHLGSGYKYGYVFQCNWVNGTSNTPATFTIGAQPVRYRKTGVRSFYMDQNGDVRAADKNGLPANVNDPIIDDCTDGSASKNEECTLSDLRMLSSAEMTYASMNNGVFGDFPQLYLAGLLRSDLRDMASRGYVYSYRSTTAGTFGITATPQTYPASAILSFYIDQTGIIRGGDKNGSSANEKDPPINP